MFWWIQRDKPRVFGQWAIVYSVAGSGNYHDARGIDVPLRAGDMILVFPEVAHSYGPAPGGIWNELYVCFRGPVFESWRDAELFDVRNPVFHWKAPHIGLEILQPFFSKLNQPGQSMLESVTMWQQILSRIFLPRSIRDAREQRPAWFLQAVDLLERAAADDEKTLRSIAESAGETLSLLQKAGGIGAIQAVDVSNTESVRAAFADLSRLDVLVNNAGIAHIGNVLNTSPEDLDRLYQINVRGAYHCLHFGIPVMLKNGGGSIVNLASIASKVGIPDRFAYSMSKGAVFSMTLL